MNNEQLKRNDFALQNGGSFLQSFEWGEFQKSLGRKIWRIKNDDFQASIIQHRLPFGRNYLYCPRGPVFDFQRSNLQNIIARLKEVRPPEMKGVIFFRIDPEVMMGQGSEDILKEFDFRKSFKEIQPKRTLILDLTKSENEILAGMHQKTRYNIRVAERHGVKFSIFPSDFACERTRWRAGNSQFSINPKMSNDQNFEIFWKLLEQTTKRDKFRPHPKNYYQKMLGTLSEVESPNISAISGGSTSENKSVAKLFLAEYQNKIIAANIVIFFGNRATYLHGASDFEYRNLMAPYLLHWQQILEAKKGGLSEYDFWGIDEKKWPGLTRFKKGFGGKELEYIGAWDLVFDKKLYRVYKAGNRCFLVNSF